MSGHDDSDPSFSIFRRGGRTIAKCHGACDRVWTPVQLASEVWGVSMPEAAERLAARVGLSVAPSDTNGTRSTPDPEDEPDRETARRQARELWEESEEPDPSRAYLARKGVGAYGVRSLGDMLLVPARDVDGELHAVQKVYEDGGKFFNNGGSPHGRFHLIGPEPNGRLIIAEGYATAATIHEATGLPVAVGFNAGNLLPVAEALHARFPGARITIAGDNDHETEGNPGRTKAHAAARAVGGLVAVPEFAEGESGTDWNDFAAVHNLEAVRAAIEVPAVPEEMLVEPEIVEPPEEGAYDREKNGGIVANHQGNIRLALAKLGVGVSYDEFADRLLLRRGDAEPEYLDDASLDRVWLEIDSEEGFRPSAGFFRTVVADYARQNAFHPVRDYLDALAWDGTPRLDRWLSEYGGAEDTEYTRAVGALVLIAAVRRIREPGCKFDEMPVLEAAQGTNKSRALATLAVREEWFSDDLPLGVDAKVVIEQTAGKWIVEAAELSGMRRRDVDALKAFLSRQRDRGRPAYARLTEERPRHFIVLGTTNEDRYLKDSTGNRRFWPVRVEGFDIERLRRDRDQLWAEAAHREAAGESIRLAPTLYPAATGEQEQRRADDAWENRLEEVLGTVCGKIPTEEVWRIVGMEDVGRRKQDDNERLGKAMRWLAFERKKLRFAGKLRYCYVRGNAREVEAEIRLRTNERGEITGAESDAVPF